MSGDAGFTPTTIELPFTKAGALTLYRMAGNPRAHNLDEEQVRIEKIPLTVDVSSRTLTVNDASGADVRGLPPGSTFLYVFTGVDMPSA